MVFTVNSSSEQWRPGDSGTVCLKEEKNKNRKKTVISEFCISQKYYSEMEK